ncbi:MAG TPA: RNA 2',3'-cyclic phosphodiesterase [Bacteroidetes bacterium]|nr:RNA 2',3'-cyclic phosphodiesterase [Bacteroidota bacterium]
MKRIFLAIPVGQDDKLIHYYKKIRDMLQEEKIKWVKPENLHLTLHFFGDTGEEDIGRLNSLLSVRMKDLTGFDLVFNGAGVFPGVHRPRVLWFRVTPSEALNELVNAVEEVLIKGDFDLPDKPFSPHLTIGRIRWLENRQRFVRILGEYREKEIARLTIQELYLYESILKPGGPEYHVLHRYILE